MQSCSKRNELPLNAKLCVRFLFLIHAEYSKVGSFFFCADMTRAGLTLFTVTYFHFFEMLSTVRFSIIFSQESLIKTILYC